MRRIKLSEVAASVFALSRHSFLITNSTGEIIEINDAFIGSTGYTREEAIGNRPNLLSSGRQSPAFYSSMWNEIQTSGYWSGEIWNRHKDGTISPQILTISAIPGATDSEPLYVALYTDITTIKETQSKLEAGAHYDALTGLPNRVLLSQRLLQSMAHSRESNRPLAVVYFDLDGFKNVNDTHGHNIGDQLLVALSKRMQRAMREGVSRRNDILARIGGDEFVAVLGDLSHQDDCIPVMQRLLNAISSKISVGGLTLQISASMGVTIFPEDDSDADRLMRHADQAMYAAKQGGKNRYEIFDIQRAMAVQSQAAHLMHLRRAIDKHEFILHYQPQVNMKTGAIVGVEALLRWKHPARGLLYPDAFLPIIENHPLSIDVGNWVIENVLKQISDWQEQGFFITAGINIGVLQLQQDNFMSTLKQQLAKYPEVSPSCIEFEILETSAMQDINKISEVMIACQKIGVNFALDDFGTGYSSLAHLKHLPANLLKIDKSFVCEMLNDSDDMAIVNGIIGLAMAFGRGVIAEGVESIAHGNMLLPLNCKLAQGNIIAKPMPAKDIPKWAKTWKPDASWSNFGGVPTSRDKAKQLDVRIGNAK